MLTELQKVHFLEEAAKLVEMGWCQSVLAMDELGNECEVDAPEVRKVCTAGGIYRALHFEGFLDEEDSRELFDLVRRHLGYNLLLGDWNDGKCTSQEEAAMALRGTARDIAVPTICSPISKRKEPI
jgi:hypothetical protein